MSRSQDPKIRSNQVMWKISVAGLNTFQQLYGGAATPEIQGLMLVVMNWWFDGFGDGNQSVAYCWRSETYNLSVSGKVGVKATTQEPHCGIEPIQWTLMMAVMLSVVNHRFFIFIPTWAEDPKLPDILRLKPPTSHEPFIASWAWNIHMLRQYSSDGAWSSKRSKKYTLQEFFHVHERRHDTSAIYRWFPKFLPTSFFQIMLIYWIPHPGPRCCGLWDRTGH